MPKILVVETSPRGEASISRQLTKRVVSNWRLLNQDGEVVTRDLAVAALPHVTMPWLSAYFTPPNTHTPDMAAQLRLSDALVEELLAADELVIATPVYNYNIPASLKAWIDHIVRKGLTLGFDGKGLLTGKKATVIIASGGIYGAASPIEHLNFAPRYLESILNVLGITDVTIIHGEGAKAVDLGEATMDKFVDAVVPEMKRSAAA
ncbi:NAD(P)H-dependent oxidoreductase [Devosia sp. 1566]|uniref:FMN-dependent NADH-azoreductase n=1 Tax=Devosia sp. 1566 TaxID=2499144 RepID=UPI000FD7BEF2|nr:NAD(P)H-dependent oxidoreductase [Devosia sp. 1566]